MQFRIHDARYVLSVPKASLLPPPEAPEVAFVGRSNVGKSSLMNTLLDRKGLVKVSSTPGRTRMISQFMVDLSRIDGEQSERRQVCLVDLPGYGFAEASKTERQRFLPMIEEYLSSREALAAVCQLFDIRHEPSALDREAFFALSKLGAVHVLVATKADKLPLAKQRPALKVIAKPFGISTTNFSLFSSETRKGREELWQRIWEALP